jgi:hypothetical protein
MSIRGSFLWVSLLLVGCPGYSGFESDGEQVSFHDPNIHVGNGVLRAGGRVLEGSAFCPTLHAVPREVQVDGGFFGTWTRIEEIEDRYAYECFDHRLEGAEWTIRPTARDAGDRVCLRVGAGEPVVRWSLEPAQCDWTGEEFEPEEDATMLRVVPLAGAFAALVPVPELLADEYLVPGPAGAFPQNDRPTPGGTIGVYEGGSTGFPLEVLGADGLPAGIQWGGLISEGQLPPMDGVTRLVVRPLRGATPTMEVDPDAPRVSFSLDNEAEAEVVLRLNASEFLVARLIGVGPEDIASVELAPGHFPGGTVAEPWGEPFGARLVVRDPGGLLIYGAPVEWSVDGAVIEGGTAESIGLFPGPDYLALQADPVVVAEVRETPGQYLMVAGLSATLGEWTASADLSWWEIVEERPQPIPEEEEAATLRLPGCSAPGSAASGVGLLCLLPTLRLRRRR